jgi:hypothetical protein
LRPQRQVALIGATFMRAARLPVRRGAAPAIALAFASTFACASRPSDARADETPSVRPLVGLGGLLVPINGGIFGVAAQLGAVFPRSPWDFRAMVTAYQAYDADTIARGVFFHAHATRWYGAVYGLGFGAGLGFAGFENRTGRGWNGGDISIGGYFTPFTLRLARRLELAGHLGVLEYPFHDIKPWTFVTVSIQFG